MRESPQVPFAALEPAKDRSRALYWYRNAPIPEFAHRTAEQRVADRQSEAVLSYLSSIGGGSSG
jgi:hypothetical protein